MYWSQANPNLLSNYPSNKTLIKYKTNYNSHIPSSYEVENIKDVKEKILEIC